LDSDDILYTLDFTKDKVKYCCVHGNLGHNLAGSVNGDKDPKYNNKLRSCRQCLLTELDLTSALSCGVISHIGYQKNGPVGINTIVDTINYVLSSTTTFSKDLSKALRIPEYDLIKRRKLILEICAGESNRLGATLEEIKYIRDLVLSQYRDQVKVCIDTCHIFGGGIYDLGKSKHICQFFQDYNNILGISTLDVIHLNDSKELFNSKKDRHESLAEGYIFGKDGGENSLMDFVRISSGLNIPLIIETPNSYKDVQYIKKNI